MIREFFHQYAGQWVAFWAGFCVGILWCRIFIFRRAG